MQDDLFYEFYEYEKESCEEFRLYEQEELMDNLLNAAFGIDTEVPDDTDEEWTLAIYDRLVDVEYDMLQSTWDRETKDSRNSRNENSDGEQKYEKKQKSSEGIYSKFYQLFKRLILAMIIEIYLFKYADYFDFESRLFTAGDVIKHKFDESMYVVLNVLRKGDRYFLEVAYMTDICTDIALRGDRLVTFEGKEWLVLEQTSLLMPEYIAGRFDCKGHVDLASSRLPCLNKNSYAFRKALEVPLIKIEEYWLKQEPEDETLKILRRMMNLE